MVVGRKTDGNARNAVVVAKVEFRKEVLVKVVLDRVMMRNRKGKVG